MAFSIRNSHVWCDPVSLAMWGMDQTAYTASGGAIALADNPVSGDLRARVLRLDCPDGNDDLAYMRSQLVRLPHGALPTTVNAAASLTQCWLRLRIMIDVDVAPDNGSDVWAAKLRTSGGADLAILKLIYVSATGKFRFGLGSTVATGFAAGREFAPGQWHDVILGYHESTSITLMTRLAGESDYTTEATGGTITGTGTVGTIHYGITRASWTAGPAYGLRMCLDRLAVSHVSAADAQWERLAIGSGVRDVTQTAVSAVLMAPPGLFAADAARFVVATDPSFTDPIYGTDVALSSVVHGAVRLPIVSGLVPSIQHYGRIDVLAAGSVVWTSDTYKFHTLPVAGQALAQRWWMASCHTSRATHHPYDASEAICDLIEADGIPYMGMIHNGDQGYEYSSQTQADDDYGVGAGGYAPTAAAEYECIYREFLSDPSHERARHLGPQIIQPDDHEIVDDADGNMRPGGSSADTMAATYRPGIYPAGVTLGDLWDAGLAPHRAIFTDAWIERAGPYYRAWSSGRARIVLIDSRTERDPTAQTWVNRDGKQLDWIMAQIDAFADDRGANLLILVNNTAFGLLAAKSSEGWERHAQAELDEVVDHIYDVVQQDKRVLCVSGDDHVGYCFHSAITTDAHPVMSEPFVGELKSSGCAVSYMDMMSAYSGRDDVHWYFDGTGMAATSCLRTSGVLLTLPPSALTIHATAEHD